mmetsp:Transcript_45869/g.109218  ORF Transcript_45869/g.109218 Transcript_45869/m.109218 type:complete len:531 (+) Transcript_45869:88-1680(+)|eukprot:CAMPEP_0178432710 /NCGR_PEP_ID=MMETSP0689_2-20121128/32529_1 /TAXON_ID=160604 /ORGANISM="Amphidinium massartii, Strain CS-259" /LENGTH=530 /DNA_ID=CAMNT_0020054713 /DNA_START=26 /DNA_END=1618 /DNA_ORIENTATION=-
MVYYYNPVRGFTAGVIAVEASYFKQMFFEPETWLFGVGHIFFSAYIKAYLNANDGQFPSWFEPLDTFSSSLVGSMVTFLMVFFFAECYGRYKDVYNACMEIDEGAKNFVKEMITYLKPEKFSSHVRLASKYIIAAIFLHYLTLAGPGGKVDADEWALVRQKDLLNDTEIAFLQQCGRRHRTILMCWCERVVWHATHAAEPELFSPPEKAALANRFAMHNKQMENSFRRVDNILALPVPFAYFHLMNVGVFLNLLLLSWSLNSVGAVRDWGYTPMLAPFLFFMTLLLGIRCTAAHLADPFRKEAGDRLQTALPIDAFINTGHDEIVMLLETINETSPDPVRDRLEKAMRPKSRSAPEVGHVPCDIRGQGIAGSERDSHAAHEILSFRPSELFNPVITGERMIKEATGAFFQRLEQFKYWHRKVCIGPEEPHVSFRWNIVSKEGAEIAPFIEMLRAKSLEIKGDERRRSSSAAKESDSDSPGSPYSSGDRFRTGDESPQRTVLGEKALEEVALANGGRAVTGWQAESTEISI